MAAPTIALPLFPASGRTGGRYAITVLGTGFRLPAAPPARGVAPKPAPSVRAWFQGPDGEVTEAERVDVLSSTRLLVIAPSHGPGTAALLVANVDASGATIPGETATAAAAFTFRRPMLSGEGRSAERILARVVRAFALLVEREVVENVSITVHTDFDANDGDNANGFDAKMPSLVLVGPTLQSSRFYAENVRRTVDNHDGSFSELRPARTVDLGFTIIGVSEFKQELLNLAQETAAFFERNPWLTVARDPADPSAGTVRFELALTGDAETSGSPNESNVRQFSLQCVIRGVTLDDEGGMVIAQRGTVTEVVLQPGQGTPGTGAGGDHITGDGTTNPITGGPAPWPTYLDPAIYQLALDEES